MHGAKEAIVGLEVVVRTSTFALAASPSSPAGDVLRAVLVTARGDCISLPSVHEAADWLTQALCACSGERLANQACWWPRCVGTAFLIPSACGARP